MKRKILALILALFLALSSAGAWASQTEELWTIYEPREDILLVNEWNPLPEDYEPEDLINVYEQEGRAFSVESEGIQLCQKVFEAAQEMFAKAKADGVKGFRMTSGYRTTKKQRQIYKDSKEGVAALPGHSEHETGLAFDVSVKGGNFGSTKQFKWMKQNCWDYGFILRYPKGAEKITGITYEPWHYRYVGVDAALEIRDLGVTLEEYLQSED